MKIFFHCIARIKGKKNTHAEQKTEILSDTDMKIKLKTEWFHPHVVGKSCNDLEIQCEIIDINT